jgi:hypothetical protein
LPEVGDRQADPDDGSEDSERIADRRGTAERGLRVCPQSREAGEPERDAEEVRRNPDDAARAVVCGASATTPLTLVV